MTMLAECLPVISIPKQLSVTSVWNDVVYNRSLCISSFRFTFFTERMGAEKSFACFLPMFVISSFIWTANLLRMHSLMLITIFCTIRHEFRTAGVLAGNVWSFRHCYHLKVCIEKAFMKSLPQRLFLSYNFSIITISHFHTNIYWHFLSFPIIF